MLQLPQMTKTNVVALSAKITSRPGFNIRIAIALPALPKGAIKHERAMRERMVAATAYRLAGSLECLAGAAGMECAICVDAHDGVVTLEHDGHTTDYAMKCLALDGCNSMKIYITEAHWTDRA